MKLAPPAVVILIASAGCAPSRDCAAELWYLDGGAGEVAVTGDFNGWGSQPMETDGAGTWHARLELPAGAYEYLIEVDG